MAEFYPTFRYHPIEAPQGRKFTDEAEFNSLGPDWVDTPTKFAPADAEEAGEKAEISAITEVAPAITKKKGRKATETIQ